MLRNFRITRSLITNALLVLVAAALIFIPDAKAGLMNGLMKIGFFKPDTEQNTVSNFDAGNVAFKDGTGKVVSLTELKGKVVFINFWATWCPPCRAEMPSLNKLYKQYKTNTDLVFITVDADNDYAKAKKFLDRRKFDLPLYTVASEIPATLFSGSLPTTAVLDKQGKLAFRHEGMADYSDTRFTSFLEGLLQ